MATPPVIDRNLLRHLAELARLHVPADRQEALLQQVQRVVEAFDAVRDLPPASAPAPAPALSAAPLRPDQPEAPLPLAEVLANAPVAAGGMFVVPRVVEG
ncbi:MAG: aspartyl/glutamyl-tRNA amidotransferase subunit C [Planctomycetes bacterium]|nr:aspartyl/glutamyl-tRNA amidotransferase subunit C [Planctomycetota bacterium]